MIDILKLLLLGLDTEIVARMGNRILRWEQIRKAGASGRVFPSGNWKGWPGL